MGRGSAAGTSVTPAKSIRQGLPISRRRGATRHPVTSATTGRHARARHKNGSRVAVTAKRPAYCRARRGPAVLAKAALAIVAISQARTRQSGAAGGVLIGPQTRHSRRRRATRRRRGRRPTAAFSTSESEGQVPSAPALAPASAVVLGLALVIITRHGNTEEHSP